MKQAWILALCFSFALGAQGCCRVPTKPRADAVTPIAPTGHTPPAIVTPRMPVASGLSSAENQAATALRGSDIYFYFDSAVLTDSAQAVLRQKAQILKENPRLRVILEGHCDERGTDKYNMNLGSRRAKAAHDYLVNLGVPQNQLQVVSFGKMHPAVSGQGENVWSQNRRVAFDVSLVN